MMVHNAVSRARKQNNLFCTLGTFNFEMTAKGCQCANGLIGEVNVLLGLSDKILALAIEKYFCHSVGYAVRPM